MHSFLFYWLIPRLGRMLIGFIGWTMRLRFLDRARLEQIKQRYNNVIFAFWHNRLVFMPYEYAAELPGRKLAVMVSQSRDGQVIAGIIERFGFKSIRGSTTRGGKAALREMVKVLKAGHDGAFTPDGPRGPRYEAGPGVVVLSHLTGLPIVPISWDASRKIVLNSWDKLMIPLPFSKAVFAIGDPIEVGADANHNVLQEKVLEVKTALNRLSDRCALELTEK